MYTIRRIHIRHTYICKCIVFITVNLHLDKVANTIIKFQFQTHLSAHIWSAEAGLRRTADTVGLSQMNGNGDC